MRDTGWRGTVIANRTLSVGPGRTSITLRAWLSDEGADVFGTIDLNVLDAPAANAKRAAEDALRQLCRDTLACLGDG